MNNVIDTILIGVGATLVMDIWSIIRKALLQVEYPNYGLVGRWLIHMPSGTFYHCSIKQARPIAGEHVIGWGVHYLIGVIFAALLIAIVGSEWLFSPTLAPAIMVGLATLLAPFFLMQPGMGAGIAAAKTPRPWHARFQSLLTHLVFGCGLYLSAIAIQLFRVA